MFSRPLDPVSAVHNSVTIHRADVCGTGVMVLPRTPIPRYGEEEDVAELADEVDLSMLPPG